MTSAQTKAPHTLLPAGAPIHSARSAFTTIVNGFSSANQRSPAGIDSTGTNADEMNVSGKMTMKPSELADSGDETSSPSSANTHENVYPKSSSSTTPPRISRALAWNEKPMISPVVVSTTIDRALVPMSDSVRPASTA